MQQWIIVQCVSVIWKGLPVQWSLVRHACPLTRETTKQATKQYKQKVRSPISMSLTSCLWLREGASSSFRRSARALCRKVSLRKSKLGLSSLLPYFAILLYWWAAVNWRMPWTFQRIAFDALSCEKAASARFPLRAFTSVDSLRVMQTRTMSGQTIEPTTATDGANGYSSSSGQTLKPTSAQPSKEQVGLSWLSQDLPWFLFNVPIRFIRSNQT